jgi:predicted nucleic acid-binding protein
VIDALSAGASPLAPQTEDWLAASAAVGRLGGDAITKSRSFRNDALLAAQCARLKTTLVTWNVRDFRRLGRHLPVEVREPFP